ncbi:MAG: rhomboid family intramembrane serine protease [Deltaproteobacteria bacterium]|nr:rhomboid family intramembrane serine protease [Deltaproteobacteria bacterium]
MGLPSSLPAAGHRSVALGREPDSKRADGNPRSNPPLGTVGLILASSLVLLYQELVLSGDPWLLYAGGAIPFELANQKDLVDGNLHPPALLPLPFTIFSAMFLHGATTHLLGNAWFLWVFGKSVEGALGTGRFLFFYFLTGVLAEIFQVAMNPGSRIPIVGASGAIAGVLGAFLVLYPRARVDLLLFVSVVVDVVAVPSYIALGAWFLWQLLSDSADGSIAIWAHVGGFLMGAASCKLLACKALPIERPSWNATATESSSSPR